jgi:phosphoribosylformylglycinamidine synthase
MPVSEGKEGNAMPMYLASIRVMLKPTVLDPQGAAVSRSLVSMGYAGVRGVRVGKHLELELEAENEDEARRAVDDMCHRLLSNPVIEEYRFVLERGDTRR